MASVNAIVHLFASVGLVLLIVFALKVQKQRDLLRRLISLGNSKAVHIAWPLDFLKQLAAALGVDCIDETGRLKSRPHKILLRDVSIFIRNHKIIDIKLKEDQDQNCVIEIRTKQGDGFPDDNWSERLSKALGHTVLHIPS